MQGSGAAVAGRVLSIEQRDRTDGEVTERVADLTIVTDAGVVRTFTLGPGVGVRLAEPEMRGELSQYLDLVGSTRAQDVRRLRIGTSGTGSRDLFVSYVSEVPVWKSTYRLVIPSTGTRAPFLQGWAIVDNTLGEDWTDVELSLVAGRTAVLRAADLAAALHPPARRAAAEHGPAHAADARRHDADLREVRGGCGCRREATSARGARHGVVGRPPSAPPPAPPAARVAATRQRERA